MLWLRIFLVFAFSAAVLGSRKSKFREEHLVREDTKQTVKQRGPKLFSLFNIVQFRNEPCQTTETLSSSNNRNGTCYSSTECQDKGGQSKGSCASGFGVCCLFLVSDSGSTVVQNCTYIQSPGNGGSTTANVQSSYTYTVDKVSSEVCSLRLDFETFTLVGTDGTGNVDEGVCIDTFSISTSPQQTPVICGENSGQHMYVEYGDSDSLTLAINLDVAGDNPTSSRQWDIKTSQIECGNAGSAPPSGCLQYLTGLTGRITTFNYNNANDNHLNDQQYTVCIRPELGYCCVQYQVCGDGVFQLSPVDGAATDDDCATLDYIAIPSSAPTCNPTGSASAATDSRYCGFFLNSVAGAVVNAPVCDCTAPFTVDIYTNSLADGQTVTGTSAAVNANPSRGVCLEYTQIPC